MGGMHRAATPPLEVLPKREPARRDPLIGVISHHELYTLDKLKERLGMGERAWWKLRDAGLKLVVIGPNRYVLGSEVLRVMGELGQCHESQSKSSASPRASS